MSDRIFHRCHRCHTVYAAGWSYDPKGRPICADCTRSVEAVHPAYQTDPEQGQQQALTFGATP